LNDDRYGILSSLSAKPKLSKVELRSAEVWKMAWKWLSRYLGRQREERIAHVMRMSSHDFQVRAKANSFVDRAEERVEPARFCSLEVDDESTGCVKVP